MKVIPVSSRSLAAAIAFAVTLTLAAGACNRVPYTGRRSVVLLPFSSELELGAQAYKEILADETIITEGDQAKAVRVVGRRIARRTPSNFRNLDWEFRLIKSDSINAFCLPGGKVAVYQGILPAMKTEAGLAAVLGHEAGHAVARHGAERISGTMLLNLGLAVADITLSDSEHHDGILAMLGLGASLGVVLPFSRANELEADYLGGIFMAKAGYDPRESVGVWERMSSMYGDQPVAIFSTHPTNRKRIERLSEEMPTFMRYYKRAKKQYGEGTTLK
jgi:predicted Zn-dependent protease